MPISAVRWYSSRTRRRLKARDTAQPPPRLPIPHYEGDDVLNKKQ
jgi:hypothetical protein